MKVLMLGPAREVHGGISAVVNNYYEAGLDQKVDLTYLATMKEGSKLKKLMVALFAYLRFCRQVGQYDIVHVNAASDNSFWRKSVFIRKAKKAGKKVLLHQHGGDFKNYYANKLSPRRRAKVRNVLALCDRILVLSESFKNYFSMLTDKEKIEVLPNAIFVPQSIIPKNENARFDILYLGRICREKGIYELLKAIDCLTEEYPQLHLYLGGIFEDRDLKDEVEKRKDCVTFLGWINGKEKENYLRKCGILVLPSYFEGFPVSILDGMAYRCIVVASHVGAIPEIIQNGETGIIVSPQNINELKDALLKVIIDPLFGEKLSLNAYHVVAEKYTLEHNVLQLTSIYNSL